MRVLFLSQWFQPEPNFKGLPLAVALRARGFEVEVLTGFPNYPGGKLYPGYRVRLRQRERLEGIAVTRAPLYPSHDRSALRRILNYVSFSLSSALHALTIPRPDVVYLYTPPMTAALAAVVLRLVRRVPFVIDVQDLWPETLAATGMVNNRAALNAVGRWTDFVFRLASRIVVLSPGFARRIGERAPGSQISVIYNWAPEEIAGLRLPDVPVSAEPRPIEILFAGNMGKAQALETVLRAARWLQDQALPVRFVFVGGGVEVAALQALARDLELANVHFLPHRQPSEMPPLFAAADALLVHLRDDPLFEITIPSKIQAYLAVGRPILVGVRGDGADLVRAAGAGIAFTPESTEELAAAVARLLRLSPAERAAMGEAGRRYYQATLAFDKGVDALAQVLRDAAGSGHARAAQP